ncbi:uncharacterized protein PG986_003928 [Apiospora aurea]|uniref:Uncharacterized protein n=1 Tax=Apiospora aurea TaxID=335848 RepID=A0ABR1QL51_9PEZI
MAPILRLAASVAALADDLNFALIDAAARPATGFDLAPVLMADVSNYTTPLALAGTSIRAPLDCNGQDTYLGQQIFTDGPFSLARCAAACTAQRAWEAEHYNKKPCRFFNTYMLFQVTIAEDIEDTFSLPVGQTCSLYSETWDTSFGTDQGQWRGGVQFYIGSSFVASFAPDPSSGECPATTATPEVTTTPTPTPTPSPSPSGLTTMTVTTTTTAIL